MLRSAIGLGAEGVRHDIELAKHHGIAYYLTPEGTTEMHGTDRQIQAFADAVRFAEQGLVESNLPRRAWINQPSSLQPLHALHGTNVLVVADDTGFCRAYFLSGDVISIRVKRESLSPGWRTS